MIKGMTGFGSAQITTKDVKIFLEIKSVNHRYFDISFYLPIGFASIENRVRQVIQKQIERGKINLSIKITQKAASSIQINKDVVRAYLKNAQLLNKEFKLKNDLGLADVVKLPGVFETKEITINPEDVWPQIEQGLKKAVSSLSTMRQREGKAIGEDINGQLKHMLIAIREIKKRQTAVLKDKKQTLSEDEILSFQKNTDINEELARLAHYLDETKSMLKSKNTIGKNIDFIAQEMQRETNTIGSKVQDKIVSNVVISLKGHVEKIREQAQNIE